MFPVEGPTSDVGFGVVGVLVVTPGAGVGVGVWLAGTCVGFCVGAGVRVAGAGVRVAGAGVVVVVVVSDSPG